LRAVPVPFFNSTVIPERNRFNRRLSGKFIFRPPMISSFFPRSPLSRGQVL
jgi:hypothetical protein